MQWGQNIYGVAINMPFHELLPTNKSCGKCKISLETVELKCDLKATSASLRVAKQDKCIS